MRNAIKYKLFFIFFAAIILVTVCLNYKINRYIEHENKTVNFILKYKNIEKSLYVKEYLINRWMTGSDNEKSHLYLLKLDEEPYHMMDAWHHSILDLYKGPLSDIIQVDFSQGDNPFGMENFLKDELEKDWVRLPDDPDFPDFKVYNAKNLLRDENISGFKTRYLIPNDLEFSSFLYIQCPIPTRIGPVERFYCEAHTYLGDFVYADYSFSFSQLSKWKEINERVKQRFLTMLQKPIDNSLSDSESDNRSQ